MPRMWRFRSLLIAEMTVGLAVNAALILFPNMTPSMFMNVVVTGFLLWAAGFGFGIYRWGVRGLWLLLGLPLFFVHFVLLTMLSGI
jgi:hypothetical protein